MRSTTSSRMRSPADPRIPMVVVEVMAPVAAEVREEAALAVVVGQVAEMAVVVAAVRHQAVVEILVAAVALVEGQAELVDRVVAHSLG